MSTSTIVIDTAPPTGSRGMRASLRLIALITAIALSLMVAGSGTAANASQVAQVESTTFEAEDGTYSVQVDRNAHSATVIAPDGEVSTFGPNSAIWDAEHTELPAPSAPGNTITDASSTACTWAIYAVSIIHSAGWAGLLAAAAVNPALAFIVLMGQGAFWTWLGTNC